TGAAAQFVARAIGSAVAGTHHLFIVVLRVLDHSQAELFHIRLAGRATSVLASTAENGEKNSGEDCNDSNNDKQFDEGETCFFEINVLHKKNCLGPGKRVNVRKP